MMENHSIIQEKIKQAVKILEEKGIDLWLTFVRETRANGDPVLQLIYGHDLTWQSALIITRTGRRIAIIGHFEAETARRTEAYDTVIPYHEGISEHLNATLRQLNPRLIAINTSTNDVLADGLTHGMYQLLLAYLDGTPYKSRIVSAEEIIAELRGRKVATEIDLISAAVRTTEKIIADTFEFIQPGMSEIEVSDYMHNQVSELGLETAWEYDKCPIVNAGPDSSGGHTGPSEIRLARGKLLHIDFGVRQKGYCADIQRVMYFLGSGEERPPEAVQRAFDTVVLAIEEAVRVMKPGITGAEVDRVARNVVTEAGYPAYMHATGHQMGRYAHDGGGILGPEWERYGSTPYQPLKVGEVYTIEPGIFVPEFGIVGIEEDVFISENGAEYISEPQKAFFMK